ncbi:MAG: hypothetical protein ABEH59_07440 [Halobacteriales archaeon]
MDREDLILETTRLFGYQRRGQAIKERIDEAIDLLLEHDLIQETEKVKMVKEEVDDAILDTVY